MSEIRQEPGWLLDLYPKRLGSALVQDAVEGDETLHVIDVTHFDEGGGSFSLNDVVFGYSGTDPDTDEVILNSALLEDAGEEGDMVASWDEDNEAPETVYIGLVEFAGSKSDDNPITAQLHHGLVPYTKLGPRPGRGEVILLEQKDSKWRIIDIRNKAVALNLEDADPDTLPDGAAPAAPENLELSTNTYMVSGVPRARIVAGWDAVTTTASGDDFPTGVSVEFYEVQKQAGIGDTDTAWIPAAVTPSTVLTATIEDFVVGSEWAIRVRALTNKGARGEWSEIVSVVTAIDNTAPNQPAPPVVTSRLGVFNVSWSGLDFLGNPMPVDFAYAELHKSAGVITPTKGDPTTLVDTFPRAGSVAIKGDYSVAAHFKMLAVDTSGNASTASIDVTATPAPLVDVSNFPDDAMEDLYARTGHFIFIEADQINANSAAIGLLETGELIGAIVQGGEFRTNATPTSGGIRIRDLDGIKAWAPGGGTPTFEVDRTTGLMTARGGNFANGAISGGSITGTTITGGSFTTGGANPMTLNATGITWTSGSSITDIGDIIMNPGAFGGQVRVLGGMTLGNFLDMGGYAISGVSTINTSGTVTVFRLVTGIGTSGAAANTFMDSAGMILKSTSSARYKYDVDDADLDPTVALQLRATTHRRFDDPDYDEANPSAGALYLSFIAEEAAAASPWLATYDEDGLPDGINWQAVAMFTLEALKAERAERLQDREDVEARLVGAGL